MRSAPVACASAVILNAGIAIGIVFVLHGVGRLTPIPCVAAPFGSTAIACGFVLILDLTILPKMGIGYLKMAALLVSILGLLSVWLGLYPVSPLGFGRNGRSVIEGFRITRYGWPPGFVGLGEMVTVNAGAAVEIEPIPMVGVHMACQWESGAGGAFDDPDNCDVAYVAPANRTFDYLHVLARPSCGLPEFDAELKASIEP